MEVRVGDEVGQGEGAVLERLEDLGQRLLELVLRGLKVETLRLQHQVRLEETLTHVFGVVLQCVLRHTLEEKGREGGTRITVSPLSGCTRTGTVNASFTNNCQKDFVALLFYIKITVWIIKMKLSKVILTRCTPPPA